MEPRSIKDEPSNATVDDASGPCVTEAGSTKQVRGAMVRGMQRRLVALAAVLAVVVVPAIVTGCSKSKDNDAKSAKADETTTTEHVIPEPGTPENPIAYAYRITGDPGTNVSVVSEVSGDGVDPAPMTQVWTVSEDPVSMMLPTGATSGTIRIEVTDGATATLELIRGHANDPADSQAGLRAIETLDKVTAESGVPAQVTLPGHRADAGDATDEGGAADATDAPDTAEPPDGTQPTEQQESTDSAGS